jgi:Trypsin
MAGSEDELRVPPARRLRFACLIGVPFLIALALPAITVASGMAPRSRLARIQGAGHARGIRWPSPAHRTLVSTAPKLRQQIVGGLPAAAGTAPWLAYIQNVVGSRRYGCTGTVVAPNLVLTAGHCGEDITTGSVYPPGGYTVVTGSLDYNDSSARQLSGVSQVIVYPGFNRITTDGDAALLVLSTPTTAPPIALATPGAAGLLTPGSADLITGWGETIGGDTSSSPTALRWATTVLQSSSYCNYTLAFGPFDPATELCTINAPTYATSTCFGDSGGPLLANDLTGQLGTPTEVGITSRVVGYCSTTYPDIFTRVDTIYPWVQSSITALTPAAPPPPPPPLPPPPPAPLAGLYGGRTRQGWPITLRVATNQHSLTALRFSYGQTCQLHHQHVAYQITELAGRSSWPLNASRGLGFSHRFSDNRGEHYRISAAFNTGGYVSGTLRVLWRTQRYGTCDSGTVHWRAHR